MVGMAAAMFLAALSPNLEAQKYRAAYHRAQAGEVVVVKIEKTGAPVPPGTYELTRDMGCGVPKVLMRRVEAVVVTPVIQPQPVIQPFQPRPFIPYQPLNCPT